MKYKFLKVRIIIPSLIVIMLLVIVIMFFAGSLELGAISYDNISFDTEGFLKPEYVTIDGKSEWRINDSSIDKKKYITDSGNYVMYINEDTTIISIYEKLDGWTKGDTSKERILYSTSRTESNASADQKSNVVLYYYDTNGKLNSLNSYTNSVLYENKLAGNNEKYYQIRYNDDGSVDILYQIGDFSNINEVFPEKFSRTSFEDLFMGNLILFYTNETKMEKNVINVTDDAGNTQSGYQLTIASKFTDETKAGAKDEYGMAYCFDNEAALYILKNNLGTLQYNKNDSATLDEAYYFTEVPEDESVILNAEAGYWEVYNIVDTETGNLKFELGVNCNCTSSPVTYNPFITLGMINTITSEKYYPMFVETTNDNGETSSTNKAYTYRSDIDNSYYWLKATTSIPLKELYNYLVVGTYGLINTTQSLPDYLITDEEQPSMIKIYSDHFYSYSKKTVYYDYNQDGEISSDEAFVYGGYQARDEQGNYLYIDENNMIFYFDNDGNRVLNDNEGNPVSVESSGSYKPYQTGLTKEITAIENEKYDSSSEASSKAFQVAIRFVLDEEGLNTTIINESLIEGYGKDTKLDVESYYKHDNVIGKIEICKYLTTNNSSTDEGQIVLPDGSGAVISFNSVKDSQYASKYNEKPIYGNDMAINREEQGYAQQTLMFPMYGFVEQTQQKGIVAIVDKGAPQTSITANFMRSSSSGIDSFNYAFFTTYFRNSETVNITSSSSYFKVSDKLYSSDITYQYKFIKPSEDGNFNYLNVAECYRNYLINKYDLQEKEDTTKTSTPTFVFVGAYEKKKILLGVVYDAEYSLTTFKQANEIVDDLTNNGISSMNINYTLWTDEVGMDKISYKYKVNSTLGGKNDLIEFSQNVISKGYNMFLDYDATMGYGYDMPFGSLKYNAKSISGSTTNALQYVLSTGLADMTGKVGGRLSPAYYNSLVSKYMKNYVKLQTNGISLTSLGNANSSDYTKSRQVYSGDGLEYQKQALETVKNSNMKVMLDAPYDYAFQYVDCANQVPVETTLLKIVDYSIPLYQLVCSGLFDYTSKAINYNNDNSIEWNILKAIETGSNLYFEVSASDTSSLLDTNYTAWYNSYYANWKEKIIYMNKTLNNSGIYESRLVYHEYINDNLIRVKYENGLTIIINYSDSNYVDSQLGIAVRSNWFAIEELGKEE